MPVPPGDHTIKATSGHDAGVPFEANVNLSPGGHTTLLIPVAPGAKMGNNPTAIVIGTVMLLGGIGALVGGVYLVKADDSSSSSGGSDTSDSGNGPLG